MLAGLAASWPQEVATRVLAVPHGQPEAGTSPAGGRQDGSQSRLSRRAQRACIRGGDGPRARILVFAAGTPLLLGGLTLADLSWPVAAATALLILFGLPLAVIDIQVRRLPDALTGAAYAAVITCLAAASASADSWHTFGRAFAGGAFLAACYLAVALIWPAHMGAGDGKAAAAIGTVLAWIGWPALLTGTLAAFLLAGICGGVLLMSRAARLRVQIPFGPFLYAGAYVAVVAELGAAVH